MTSVDTKPYRRVLIAGSRTWHRSSLIRTELEKLFHPDTTLVSGACPTGPDTIGAGIWTQWGGIVELHPADWTKHGRVAGYRRNVVMAHLGADICLAFVRDNSPGTTSMINLAIRANIPVKRFEWET